MTVDVVKIPVGEIIVGERIRRLTGDIAALVESIRRLGLLHPVVVNSRKELIAGFRRLESVKALGWKSVSCHVVMSLDDGVAALMAERDENTCREPLTGMELVKVGEQLESLEAPKAKDRQKATQAKKGEKVGNQGGGKLPPPITDSGKTRDKVAAALGVSGKTYEKAKQVADAAEHEPETFGDLSGMMDEQSVDAAYKEMRRRRNPDPSPSPPGSVIAPAQSKRQTKVEKELQGVGIIRANEAIHCLIRIPKDDPFRDRALQIVADWIENNS